MNELNTYQNESLTEKQAEAKSLHREIMANGQLAANYLVDFCMGLKRMRDEKLYIELGYNSFDDYAEQAVGIKQRMAYQYISAYEKLGSTFLQSNARAGITKLALITKLPPAERVEIAENGLENVSVRELNEKIRELNEAQEQLSLLKTEKEEDKEALSEQEVVIKTLKEEIEALQLELSEREKDSEAVEARIRARALNEAAAQRDVWEQKARSDERLKLEKKADENAKALEEQHRAELEKLRSENQKALEALSSEKEQFRQRMAELEKQQKLPTDDPACLKFQFYYDELKNTVHSLMSAADEIKDTETADRFRFAAGKYLNIVRDKLIGKERNL